MKFFKKFLVVLMFANTTSIFATEVNNKLMEEALNANNDFSWKIFSQIQGQNDFQGKNVISSPFGLFTVLSAASNGALEGTFDEMKEALGIAPERSKVEINLGMRTYFNQLDEDKLLSANSIWVNEEKYNLNPVFKSSMLEFYNGTSKFGTFERSFGNADTVKEINQWAMDNTNNMVKDLIKELEADTVAILLNAVFFKGSWSTPFDQEKENELFYTSDTETVSSTMLQYYSYERIRHYQNERFQMVSLPFKLDNKEHSYRRSRFVLDLVLPNQKDFGVLTEQISLDDYFMAINNLSMKAVNVVVPKFNFGSEFDLNDILKSFGMVAAFDEVDANFKGLGTPKYTNRNVYISRVFQKAKTQMDRYGFKAAAVSGVTFTLESASIPPSVIYEFRADHPFLFILRDTKTNAVLFMGSIYNPNQN